MSRFPNEEPREYTEQEQQQSFIGRRMDAFAGRSREPGDAATWATVLGALMCTLLMICYSVADQPLVALGVAGLTAIWIFVMARFGGVNVFSILWGSAATDAKYPANEFYVFQSTVVVALFSLVALVVSAFTGWGFGWYGYALLAVTAIFVVIYLQSWIQPVRRL